MCLLLLGMLLSDVYAQLPPTILIPPLDQTVVIGGTARFSVVASSGGLTLSYQWYQPPHRPLQGETSSTLTRDNVSSSDEGQYFVEVKNGLGKAISSNATLAIDTPPVANNNTYTTMEDVPLIVPAASGVLANDVDVDGDVLTALLVSNVTHGTLSLVANGGFTYTPNINYYGSDSFTYRATDGIATGNVATVTINVTPVNDPPLAANDNTNTLEDVSVTIKVLANDSDPENSPLTLTGASTTNGTAVISGTNVVFRAATNFNGLVVFSYTVSDGTNSATANVTVTVTPVNDAPVANNDSYTTLEEVSLIVPPAGGILTNDVDVDGDALTALLVSDVNNGTLNLNPNGSFTYTPFSNYSGPDSFTYLAREDVYPILEENTPGGSGIDVQLGQKGAQSFRHGTSGDPGYTISKIVLYLSREATAPNANLNITIGTGMNSGAIAGSSVAINPLSITNTSSGGSFQRYEIVYATPVGLLDAGSTYYLNLECEAPNGRNIYTEYAGTNTYANGTYYDAGSNTGRDMRFAICDSISSGTATVTINVTAVNDAPVAYNDTYTNLEDVPLIVPAAAGVLTNDVDVDGDVLTALLVTNATHGTLSLSTNGGFTYTPNTNYNGSDSFAYRALDGITNSNIATVTINIAPVNDPPLAVNDSTNMLEDVSVTIKVLANDSDPEGSPLTLTGASTTNGTAVISGTNVVFRPATNFSGVVVFTYTVSDGVNSSTANVTVNVTPVNDVPLAYNDTYTTLEDVPLIVPAAAGIFANDVDVDGDVLSVLLVTNVTRGTLNWSTNGGFTYAPNTNYNGSDSFAYRPRDGATTGNIATVTITITPVNDPPIAVNDSTNALEDVNVTIKVLANDSDAEGTPVVLTGTTTTNGTAVISGTNVVFRPATNFNGVVVFSYTVSDGTNSATANVTVNVTPVNDVPVAYNDTYAAMEDLPLVVPAAAGVLTNDLDVDGDVLTALLVTNVTHGTLSWSTNGGFIYTPNTNYNGSDSFAYRARDGATTGNVATVTIIITPVNDPPIAVNDSTNTMEDVSVTIKVLANDSDPEGLPLILTGAATTNGTAVISGTNVVFRAATNFNGVVVFSYTVSDGTNSATANVAVAITPVNDVPVASNDTYTALEDVPLLVGPSEGVLTNDDVDGDVLTAMLVSNVTNGFLSLSANGGFTYTPTNNYNGRDSFTYRATDGLTTGEVATVTINITPVNDPPVANDDAYTTHKHEPLVIPTAGILTNDLDTDGDALTVSLAGYPTNGSLSLNPDRSFTYIPNNNFVGVDFFYYKAFDGVAASGVATVTITVLDTPLKFSSGVMTPDGFQLQLSGPSLSTFIIQASTNLSDWTPISTNNSGQNGSVVYTDTEAANFRHRHYRALAR